MRFEFESYEEKKERLAKWRDWFAWYPVYLDDVDRPTLVWLEVIQRRQLLPSRRYFHRRIPDFDLFI